MKHSLVIPCHNEADGVRNSLETLILTLEAEGLDFEIVAVDDRSTDATWAQLTAFAATQKIPRVRPVQHGGEHGFGLAV